MKIDNTNWYKITIVIKYLKYKITINLHEFHNASNRSALLETEQFLLQTVQTLFQLHHLIFST